jgi:hypothetical protein
LASGPSPALRFAANGPAHPSRLRAQPDFPEHPVRLEVLESRGRRPFHGHCLRSASLHGKGPIKAGNPSAEDRRAGLELQVRLHRSVLRPG